MYQRICTHMLDMIAPGFFFDYCGANFNRKHSWQIAEEELQYDNLERSEAVRTRPHDLTTIIENKMIRSLDAWPHQMGSGFYDHMFDHFQNRTSWRQ